MLHAEPKSGPCKHRARAWNHNSLLKSGHFIATSRTGCSSITKRFLRNKRRTGFVKGVRGSNISTLSASLRRHHGQLRTCCPSPSTFGALEMEQNLCRRGRALLERHAPECAAEDSTQAPHNLPRRQARSGAEVGRLEAAAMANGCDEAGGRVSLSEYPGYRLRLGVHLYSKRKVTQPSL